MSTPDINLSLRRLVPPLALVFYLAACGVSSSSNAGEHPARTIPDTPTQPVLASTKSQESMPSEAPSPTPTATAPVPPTIPPRPTPTPAPAYATLNDFWEGKARWVIDVFDTGLPMGESDTVYRGQGEFWTYLHASYQSAGVLDGCGDPVPFPGCITLWKSFDGGRHFEQASPTCLFACDSCPCENARDHMAQQQYPRIAIQAYQHVLVYEHGAYV